MDPDYQTASISKAHYEIRLEGHVEEGRTWQLQGLTVALTPQGETVLRGQLDQAALHGVLDQIRDMGVPLFAVRRLRRRRATLSKGKASTG